jgi:hypothetical protein
MEHDHPLALYCFSDDQEILGNDHHRHHWSPPLALFGASSMQFTSTEREDPIYFILPPTSKVLSVEVF